MSWSSSLDSRLLKVTFDCSGMPLTSFLDQIGQCYVSLLPILGSKKLSGTQMTLISTERIDRFKGFDTKPIIFSKEIYVQRNRRNVNHKNLFLTKKDNTVYCQNFWFSIIFIYHTLFLHPAILEIHYMLPLFPKLIFFLPLPSLTPNDLHLQNFS